MRPVSGSNSSASKPDVVAARKQTVEQLAGFGIAALQDVIVDQPEAAREKRAFARRQAVAWVFGFVAQHEFVVDQQALLDRPKRSADPRIVRWKKADKRDQQQAGVEPLGAVGLHEAVEVAVEAALADLRMDFIGDLAPPPP